MIAVLSSLCGRQTCVDMADYAENHEAFLRQFMRLEPGLPNHDAFSRLFRIIEPEPFAKALPRFASELAKMLEAVGIRQIAVDGKTLRRTFSRAEEHSPLHLISAFASESGIVLGQVAVDAKSNEIRALPVLLEMLELEDTRVTGDAMHTQRTASKLITGEGGDCVLAPKGNQKALHADDAKAWLEDPGNAETMLSHQDVDRGHGRTATVSHDIGPLQDAHRWLGFAAIGKIESVRVSEGRTLAETRICIMSRKMSARDFLKAVWTRWAIENRLHRILGVQMRKDDLRNSAGHGPVNLAGIRRLVVSLVNLQDDKISFRRWLLKAAQVPEYRLEIIANAVKLAETL